MVNINTQDHWKTVIGLPKLGRCDLSDFEHTMVVSAEWAVFLEFTDY